MSNAFLLGNTGSGTEITIGPFGSTPNLAGLSLTGTVLNMEPASGTFPGGVSTTTQSFAGNKTFVNNVSANSFIAGYTTTATAAGNTILSVTSTQQQYFTGVTTQTVTLPVVSTLALGQSYTIVNNSSGVVTVNSSGGNTLQAMAASTYLIATVISTSGTGTASWSWIYGSKTSNTNVVTYIDENSSFAASAATGYFVTATATATLPASPVQGDIIAFQVKTTDNLTIQANTGQIISMGDTSSSTAGTMVNTLTGDAVVLVYYAANSEWSAQSYIGQWGAS